MVQLIDILLVTGIVGFAVYALIKYLFGLGQVDDHKPITCAGCSSCAPDPTDLSRPI